MNARELLTYALDHELVTMSVEHDPDDEEGCNDIDLSTAEVDANGFLVEAGMSAEYVRRYQADEIGHYNVSLFKALTYCKSCCNEIEGDFMAGIFSTMESDEPDGDTLNDLANEAEDELRELVDAYKARQ